MCYLLDFTVSFDKSLYSIEEDGGSVQVVLILDKPSSDDISITVIDDRGTATGKSINVTTEIVVVSHVT